MEESVRDRAAKALYDRWRATDRELMTEWEDAGDRLRGVFLSKVDVVLGVVREELEEVVSALDVYESGHSQYMVRLSGWYWMDTELRGRGLL